jgi:hypothetical protein
VLTFAADFPAFRVPRPLEAARSRGVFTDVWASKWQEDEREKRERRF